MSWQMLLCSGPSHGQVERGPLYEGHPCPPRFSSASALHPIPCLQLPLSQHKVSFPSTDCLHYLLRDIQGWLLAFTGGFLLNCSVLRAWASSTLGLSTLEACGYLLTHPSELNRFQGESFLRLVVTQLGCDLQRQPLGFQSSIFVLLGSSLIWSYIAALNTYRY